MIGKEIEGFQIIEKLGEGGMGEVYRATDTSLGRIVALKVLHTDLTNDPQLTERFLSEARTQGQLNHPNLATLYRLFQFEGRYCMVMEFVDGETFSQMIRRVGPIAQERAVPLFKQALAGLAHAHHAGIIHRDLKPSNLMVNRDGIVKVMDFGIAKILGGRGLTATGVRLGTLYYMSPEQIRNQPLDIRTDIYALGITLYEMLTGRVPFDSNSDYDLMQQHIHHAPPPPRHFFPYLSPSIEDAVLQALEKEPARRFQTVEAFSRALDEGMKAATAAGGVTVAIPAVGMDQSVAAARQSQAVPRTPFPPATGGAPISTPPRVVTPTPPGPVVRPRTPIPPFTGQPAVSSPRVSTPLSPPPVRTPRTPMPLSGAQPPIPPPRVSTPIPPPSGSFLKPSTPVPSGPFHRAGTPIPATGGQGPVTPPPWTPSTPVPSGSYPPMPEQPALPMPGQKNPVLLIIAAVGVLVVVVVMAVVAKRFLTKPKADVTASESASNTTSPNLPSSGTTNSPAAGSTATPPSSEPVVTPPPQAGAEPTKPVETRPEVKQPKEPRKTKPTSTRPADQTNPVPTLTPEQQAQIQQQIDQEKQRELQQQLKEQQKSAPPPTPQPPPTTAETKAPQFYSYRVAHSHGGFNFDQKCTGTLTVGKTRIQFVPDSGSHAFDVPMEDVKEIKKNSGFWSVPSFHIRLKNGENYNLARFTSDNRVVSSVDILGQIDSLLPPSVKH